MTYDKLYFDRSYHYKSKVTHICPVDEVEHNLSRTFLAFRLKRCPVLVTKSNDIGNEVKLDQQ